MKLNALEGQSRFIVNQTRVDSPLMLPPLFFGDVTLVELRLFRETARGLMAVDLSTYDISLLVGPPNVRPSLGFWQLTTTEGTSPFISARASAESAQLALRNAFGMCVVDGGQGSYIVTVASAGVWALPTATFQGDTLSNVLVFQITPGTSETPAQYRIEVLEVAPARIIPADWSTGSTTPTNTFTQVSGRLWQLNLDPKADSGFFTLTVDGVTTGFVSLLCGAYDVAQALATIGKPAQVEIRANGSGFYILFSEDVTIASVGGNAVILPYQTGVLDLTSTGIRELLDGAQFAPVKLTVIIVKDGQTITAASADVTLQMPINQPATITIDAPQMAGLSFSISEDGAYMNVYKNGELIAVTPLSNP